MNKSLSVVPLVALTLVLSACGGGNIKESTPYESVSPVTSDATPTEMSSRSARGNTEMVVGQPFSATVRGTEVYTVNVTSIEPDFQCTNPDSSMYTPRGHYVKVDLEMKSAPVDVIENEYLGNPISPSSMWKYVDANGTTMNDFPWSDGSFSCISRDEMIPMTIGPGENVVGSVILDLPSLDGTIIFTDNGVDSQPEWKVVQ